MEPNLIFIDEPVYIIGDIHGQYYDLLNILKNRISLHKNVSNQNLLFLGDYVDRGLFSIQTLLLILALKINCPSKIILLRGNHESKQLTTFFNFKNQCN